MDIKPVQSTFTKFDNFLELRAIPLIIKTALEVSLFEILAHKSKTLDTIIKESQTNPLIM